MSAYVLPPGFGHIAMTIRHNGITRPAMVTFGFEVDTPPFTQANAENLDQAIADAVKAGFDSNVSIGPSRILIGQDGDPALFDTAGTTVGTATSYEGLPPNVAVLAKKGTGLSGRRNSGRTFWPFVSEVQVLETGGIDSGNQTAWNGRFTNVFNALNTALANNTAGMVILHSEAPTTPTPVTTYICSAFVATQRRRLVRS